MRNIEIIFEDDHLLVVNKPAGLLVVPTPAGEKDTLTSIINKQKKLGGAPLFPCHRLDRDTSGLIIFAKGKEIQEKMMCAFKKREVKKRYTAFVQGIPGREKGTILHRIEGVEAMTNYRIVERHEGFSVVEVEPVTGRTNQIRIHFRMIGHPLVGERKFAFPRDYKIRFKRTALHAADVAFRHPVTGKWISFSLDIPEDMKSFLKNNR